MKIGIYKEGDIKTFWDGEVLSIIIETDKIEKCRQYSEKTRNFNFILYEPWGYLTSDLQPLDHFSKVIGLQINSPSINCTLLSKHKSLERLNIKNSEFEKIDLLDFPNLYHLRCSYTKKIHGLSSSKQLTSLGLQRSYKKENFESLEFLSDLKGLEYLGIGNSKITDIDCIGFFKKLTWLSLTDNKNLVSIEKINSVSPTLQKLEIENSRKISSFDELGSLINLTYLRLSDCGKINSINFVKKMPTLNFFSFVDTEVIDGDLSPLIDKKFRHIGFFNKKHYSHKNEEILKLIAVLRNA